MALRREVDQLRKAVEARMPGGPGGACPGQLVPIAIRDAAPGEADPQPEPPPCPLCRRRHWAPAQGVRAVVAVRCPPRGDLGGGEGEGEKGEGRSPT